MKANVTRVAFGVFTLPSVSTSICARQCLSCKTVNLSLHLVFVGEILIWFVHFSARNNSCSRPLATVCILPGRKSGVHMPSRGGETGSKQAPDQMSSPFLLFKSEPQYTLNLKTTRYIRSERAKEKRKNRGRGITVEERPGLSPCCLFILLFLQDLWALSKVRGVMEECVSLEHEKKNYNIRLNWGRLGHGSFGRRPFVQINISQK